MGLRTFMKAVLFVATVWMAYTSYSFYANCSGDKVFLPGTKAFCKDVNTVIKTKTIPDTLWKNADNAMQQLVFVTWRGASLKWKSVSSQKFVQDVHTAVVTGLLKVKSYGSQVYESVETWYQKDGHKSIGAAVETVKVGLKMGKELAIDFGTYAYEVSSKAAHWIYDAGVTLAQDSEKFVEKVRKAYS